MRASLFALIAASPAFAQNASTYVPGLLQALSGAGLNRLANVSQQIGTTSIGQALFASLPSGNKTVFAPNDHAFTGTPPSNITDPNELAAILSYHVVSGSIAVSNISTSPAHSILRTALNSSQYVSLEGGKGQVLSVTNDNNTVRILEQNTAVRVVSTTTYQNLVIHVVDAVIDLPPTLPAAVAAKNLTALATAAQQAGLLSAIENTHGVTVFAPTDQAFQTALQALGGASNVNQSTLQTVLGNHVINGTSVYSTLLGQGNHTSAAGEPFSFATNSSGTYVTSGPSTARIVEADVIVANGVVHIIDGVLLNTQNNTQAASAAAASATSVAGQPTSETGAIGGSPTSTGGASSGSGRNGAVSLNVPAAQWAIALCLSLLGGALVL